MAIDWGSTIGAGLQAGSTIFVQASQNNAQKKNLEYLKWKSEEDNKLKREEWSLFGKNGFFSSSNTDIASGTTSSGSKSLIVIAVIAVVAIGAFLLLRKRN